ncbi:alpha/beta hydrolase [Saccharomonospora sp. NB11]|uniref:alpha/beta hydrolase n=1 Tax=Saccharomonospora sp. NB11 TaxID=1642298 RepID=UPI0018D0A4D3|nr:alpha/beta hydrolase [Saccharomonospora sp. NB11]
MTSVKSSRTAVLLPGTGSDERFVRAVFARPLAAMGVDVLAPPPPRGASVIEGSLALLDRLADEADAPLLVGGISLGAHLATSWAAENVDRCAGVLAALPAWNGPADTAPAAVAARASADLVDQHGLDTALDLSTCGVAPWLATELDRAWRRHGTHLAASLRAAAAHPGPALSALRSLDVPVGIAACRDDPVHPITVARDWAAALPRAALVATTLDALGSDRESLGRAATLAWLHARHQVRSA